MGGRGFWRDVLRLGGAYTAFCIGSGYATGQEILQFFTAFGRRGLWAAGIAMALYIWMGASLMGRGRALSGRTDAEIWACYCGRRLGRVMNGFVACVCFGSYVIMVAGAGAALEQQCGLPDWVGRAAMSAVCLLTVLLGLEGLVDILGAIGPAVIVFTLLIGVGGIVQGTGATGAVSVPRSCGHWALSGVLYAAFMAPLCIPFLTRLGGTGRSRRAGAWGGALGGFFLMLAVMVMSTALLVNLEAVSGRPIPTLVLAERLRPQLASLFTGVVLLGVYSTAVPQLWMICRKAGPDGSGRYRLAAAAAVLAGLGCSVLPFEALVGTVYPATGYVGIFLLLCVWVRGRRAGDARPYGLRKDQKTSAG